MSKDPKKPTIYVAGPISVGDQFHNVARAFDTAQQLLEQGWAPFVPHTTCFWHMIHRDNHYEDWLAFDFEWIKRCDALFRMPGESTGADREVLWARELGKPIIYEHIDAAQVVYRKLKERLELK